MALANSLNYRFQPRVQHLFQKPNLASGKNYFDCVRDTTLVVVHDWSFKDGAFKDKIAKDTPVPDSFQILIDSPLTTAVKKENFRAYRDSFIFCARNSLEQRSLDMRTWFLLLSRKSRWVRCDILTASHLFLVVANGLPTYMLCAFVYHMLNDYSRDLQERR